MFSFRHLISRCLLAVWLVTVTSPSFAWDLVDGAQPHEHAVMHELPDGHEEHEMHAEATHQDHGPCCPTQHEGQDDSCEDAHHHCCPGHVLGHLPAGLFSSGFAIPTLPDVTPSTSLSFTFLSRVPEGLERPPRHAA